PIQTSGIINQFEGYETLKELDWNHYRSEYGDHIRLDRVLEKEGDDPNNYKASKQADVLMLFYLFSADELRGLFEGMGYPFDPAWIPRNIDYYRSRTSHGSTLSRLVYSWVLSRSDRKRSFHEFSKALMSDFQDVQGGTTAEGIHLGAMAGTVDIMQRCYTGLEVQGDVLWFNPCLPQTLTALRMRTRFRGRWLQITLSQDEMTVTVEDGGGGAVQLGVCDTMHTIEQGQTRTFCLGEAKGTAMKVKEIMTAHAETIASTASVKAAAERMRQCDVGILPVMDGDQASGIITDRDIVVRTIAQGLNPSATSVGEVMSKQVISCGEDIDVEEAAKMMENARVRRLLVKDNEGRVCGIVSLDDLAMHHHNRGLSGEVLHEVAHPAEHPH
ncbi:MAG: CBS domain-containing protein, partial [Chitinivibrionales bacterium]|nr:CBS domain-containing protein [Chitinivibrionales bacterium]